MGLVLDAEADRIERAWQEPADSLPLRVERTRRASLEAVTRWREHLAAAPARGEP